MRYGVELPAGVEVDVGDVISAVVDAGVDVEVVDPDDLEARASSFQRCATSAGAATWTSEIVSFFLSHLCSRLLLILPILFLFDSGTSPFRLNRLCRTSRREARRTKTSTAQDLRGGQEDGMERVKTWREEEQKTHNATRRQHRLRLTIKLIPKPLDIIHSVRNNNRVARQMTLDGRGKACARILFGFRRSIRAAGET